MTRNPNFINFFFFFGHQRSEIWPILAKIESILEGSHFMPFLRCVLLKISGKSISRGHQKAEIGPVPAKMESFLEVVNIDPYAIFQSIPSTFSLWNARKPRLADWRTADARTDADQRYVSMQLYRPKQSYIQIGFQSNYKLVIALRDSDQIHSGNQATLHPTMYILWAHSNINRKPTGLLLIISILTAIICSTLFEILRL